MATYASVEGVQGGRVEGAAAQLAGQQGAIHLYCVDIQFKSCHRWRFLFKLEPVYSSDGQNNIVGWSDMRGVNFIHSLTQRKQIPAQLAQAPLPSSSAPSASSTPGSPSPVLSPKSVDTGTAGAAIEALPERFIFSFAYRLPFDITPETDGWNIYDARSEWERQFESISPKYRWRISDINKDYTLYASLRRRLHGAT